MRFEYKDSLDQNLYQLIFLCSLWTGNFSIKSLNSERFLLWLLAAFLASLSASVSCRLLLKSATTVVSGKGGGSELPAADDATLNIRPAYLSGRVPAGSSAVICLTAYSSASVFRGGNFTGAFLLFGRAGPYT